MTIWVDRYGKPCDSMRHDAKPLGVVPASELERYETVLRELLSAFSRMPDAGLRKGDPRWDWWHDTAAIRDTTRRLLGG